MAFLAPLAVPLMAVGTAISAIGLIQQGRMANREAQYQAAEMDRAAQIGDMNARNRIAEGEREVYELEQSKVKLLGENEAAVAGSGITMSGSAIHVLRDSALEIEDEIAMTRYRARTDSYNLGIGARSQQVQAGFTRAAGRNRARSGVWGAAGTVLSGFGQAASMSAQQKAGRT